MSPKVRSTGEWRGSDKGSKIQGLWNTFPPIPVILLKNIKFVLKLFSPIGFSKHEYNENIE